MSGTMVSSAFCMSKRYLDVLFREFLFLYYQLYYCIWTDIRRPRLLFYLTAIKEGSNSSIIVLESSLGGLNFNILMSAAKL